MPPLSARNAIRSAPEFYCSQITHLPGVFAACALSASGGPNRPYSSSVVSVVMIRLLSFDPGCAGDSVTVVDVRRFVVTCVCSACLADGISAVIPDGLDPQPSAAGVTVVRTIITSVSHAAVRGFPHHADPGARRGGRGLS